MRFDRWKIASNAGGWLGLSMLAVVAISDGHISAGIIEIIGAAVFACRFVIDWHKYRERRKALTSVPPKDEG